MSSSFVWITITFVLLLLIGSSYGVPITSCTTIDTPGEYTISTAIIYNSSRTLPCLNIISSVISGNNTVTIIGYSNTGEIWCQDDAGCLPAIQVAPEANMKLILQASWFNAYLTISGTFKTHVVVAGDDCTVSQLRIGHFSTPGDALRCGSGHASISYNQFYAGFATGLINTENATSFFIDNNGMYGVHGVQMAVQVGNGGNGTISKNTFSTSTSGANCNSAGDFAIYGSKEQPASSCYDILQKRGPNVTDGIYYVPATGVYGVAWPVYCDFSTAPGKAYQMLYKVNSGTEAYYGSLNQLWSDVPYPTEYANPTADTLSNKPSASYYASMVNQYRTPLISVSMRAYLLENLIMFVDFGPGTAGLYDWFLPSRILNSSYTDLPTNDSFHRSGVGRRFTPYDSRDYLRFWYMNKAGDDCDSDVGWLVVGAPSRYSGERCSDTWFPPPGSDTNPLHIFVSTTNTASPLHDKTTHTLADVFTIYGEVNNTGAKNVCAGKGNSFSMVEASRCICEVETSFLCGPCGANRMAGKTCKAGFRGIVAKGVKDTVITGNTFTSLEVGACDVGNGDGAFVAIDVRDSEGVSITQNSISECQGGVAADGNAGATIGISMTNSQNSTVQSNTIEKLSGKGFVGDKIGANTGPSYGIYVDGGVGSSIRNNFVKLLSGGSAGYTGNGSATVAIRVSSQGGDMTQNYAFDISGSKAGNGYQSSPAGSCDKTCGFEIVGSSDFRIEYNNATKVTGCATNGIPITNDEGVSIAGSAAAFWVTSSNVSLQYNKATTVNGGAANNVYNDQTYGGKAYGYHLNTTLSLYFLNTASGVVKGTTGSMIGQPAQTIKVLGATEAFVNFGACDSNMTAAELCYPSGTTCCQSNCRAASSNTTCRASAGACDPADKCYYGACPDLKSTSMCRRFVGNCDDSEYCDGVTNDCPADKYRLSGQPCGSSCGVGGTCSGNSSVCPPDETFCPNCMGYPICRELTACGAITQPGFYFLSKDLFNYGSSCFQINTNGVILGGAGHTVGCGEHYTCPPAIFSDRYPVMVTNFVFSGKFQNEVIQCVGNCTLKNSTFKNIDSTNGYPVKLLNSNSYLYNNVFTNISSNNAMVYMSGVKSFEVHNNKVSNVTFKAFFGEPLCAFWIASDFGIYPALNTILNNDISNITGSINTMSCFSRDGIEVHAIHMSRVAPNTLIKNNTVQYVTGATACPCSDVQSPSRRCKGGWTGGITSFRSYNTTVTANTVNYVYGSKGFVSGLVTGISVDMGLAFINNNTVSNIIGGSAEIAGNTSDVIGISCMATGNIRDNSVSSLYGASLADTSSDSVKPGIHGSVYGFLLDGITPRDYSGPVRPNVTMANNRVTHLVGSSGANVRSPSTQTSGTGQSVVGVYSWNMGLFISGTTVTDITSGSPGSSPAGSTSVPGNAIAVSVVNLLYSYSSNNASGVALGSFDPALVNASAVAAIEEPVFLNNITACPQQNYEADMFCYPPGVGTCFSSCIFHECKFSLGSYALEGQCSDNTVQLSGTAYNPDPFQFRVNTSSLSALNPSGNLNFTIQLANAGTTYVIRFNDSFMCSADLTVVVPAYTAPKALTDAPVISISSGNLNISATPLNDSANTGALIDVTGYLVEYRTVCNGNAGPWVSIPASAEELAAGVQVQYSYQTTYQARAVVQNCKFNSTGSPVSNITTAVNPNMPLITSVEPTQGVSTTGGKITLVGANLPSLGFFIRLNGGALNCTNPQNVNINTTTCEVPPGVGAAHSAQIVLDPSVHFSCVPQLSNVVAWSYAVPNITSTSYMSTAGGSLLIYGANFGNGSNVPTVTIGENPCSGCSVPYANGTVISCTSCPGGYERHPLLVVVADQLSSPFDYSYPICTPVCMHGVCVANATSTYCQCDSGYTGSTCSEEIVCTTPPTSTCGLCSGSVCCFFRKKMDIGTRSMLAL